MKYLALLLMVLCLAKAFIIENEEDPELEKEEPVATMNDEPNPAILNEGENEKPVKRHYGYGRYGGYRFGGSRYGGSRYRYYGKK
ncbi:unnamed protein product [Pocillopora meandrina]|uniref:Uncharacterized protein n=1 Tax=Pocillopora meandrina TaxID=46732 RepID=A0AAU9XYR8_9CNID|nr:unnamed protein product [Pocillopora meandrina]